MVVACSGWDALLDEMIKNVFPEKETFEQRPG